MVERKLALSEEADADLIALASYIAEHDGAIRASEVTERIWETMRNLAFAPGMGSGRPYLKPSARAFPVRPWTIYYETLPESGGIRVVRILDGRRDLPAIFDKP